MSKGFMKKVGFNTKKGSDSDKNYDEESGLFFQEMNMEMLMMVKML